MAGTVHRPSRVLVLVTGGTIDKEYDPLTGELTFVRTHVPRMLGEGRTTVPFDLRCLMLKDSLEMTPEDRQRIFETCLRADAKKVLVVHGTDTMVDTGRFLGEREDELPARTVVLTGSMVPFVFDHSDALFNLGTSLMAVQLAESGVFLCMNGRLFPWDRVRKNKMAGRFEQMARRGPWSDGRISGPNA